MLSMKKAREAIIAAERVIGRTLINHRPSFQQLILGRKLFSQAAGNLICFENENMELEFHRKCCEQFV